MKRRDFLKGGTLLAACLVAGLKPTEPKIIKSGWVELKSFTVQEPRWPARYGGMTGGGKTPAPFADFEYYLPEERGGFFIPEYMMGDLLDAVEHTA